MVTEQKKNANEKFAWVHNVWIPSILVLVVASSLNLLMITNLATSKTDYASEIRQINNSINHIQDSAGSLDKFTGYENSMINDLSDSTQNQFNDVANQIDAANDSIDDANNNITQTRNDLNSVKTDLKTQTDNLAKQASQISNQATLIGQKAAKTDLDNLNTSLTAQINNVISGLQITPTVTSGSINLSIKSAIAQTIAFRIDFRPQSDFPANATTMDSALLALYTTPTPVTLTSGALSVRGDYNLYMNPSDSSYHVGLISFLTQGTALTAGTTAQTRTINFTTAGSYTGTYEILITPVFTGTLTGAW